MVVQHNLKAMNSNRMLGITQSSQAKSTEKLSSGYKINRAADDAAGLSISEKMRKQIRGLTQASTNAQDGISAVQTAEGALNEVQDMLQRMNELAVKAANGTNSVDDRSYIQDEIKQLETEIDRVAETTKFNETYLLKGSEDGEKAKNLQYKQASTVNQKVYAVDSNNNTTEIAKGSFYNKLDSTATYYTTRQANAAEAASSTAFASAAVLKEDLYKKDTDNNYTLVSKGTAFDSTASYYKGNYVSANYYQNMTSVASAAVTSTGYSVSSAGIYNASGTSVSISTFVSATTGFYTNPGTASPMGDTVAYASLEGEAKTAVFTDKDGNKIAANGLSRYLNDDLTLKDGVTLHDLRINGDDVTMDDIKAFVNNSEEYTRGKLELKLHVGADATTNNQITIKLDAMDAETLGVKDIKVDGADDKNALDAIDTIKQALQRVSTQRSALGAVQNRLEHTIANLDNVVENTTSAESGIRDTDMATEMVKYSNNNILAQAGQAMLAQANQSNQGVLSLLG